MIGARVKSGISVLLVEQNVRAAVELPTGPMCSTTAVWCTKDRPPNLQWTKSACARSRVRAAKSGPRNRPAVHRNGVSTGCR